jgi:hypothetical protein
MNPTLRTILIGAITAVVVVMLLKAQEGSSGTNGRFQVVAATITIAIVNGNSIHEPTVFKIDTVTGQTWHHSTGIDTDKKFFDHWAPVQQ